MTTLTAPPNTLQASLIEALGAAQPERALEQAFHQLSRGGDLPLLLAMVKALVRAGMAGLAVRLLHAGGGLLAAEPQIAALANQLAALPSGELSHSLLQNRLEANLAALLKHSSQLRRWESELGQIDPDMRVFASVSGNAQVIRAAADRKVEFVFAFADHKAQAEAVALPDVTLETSFALVGVPSPALLQRLLNMRAAGGYDPPIDIIEPDLRVLSVWLSLIDDSSVFDSVRIAFHTGADAASEYRQSILNHAWRMPAKHWIVNHRPRWQPPAMDRKFTESLAQAVGERNRAALARVNDLYAQKTIAHWQNRFESAGRGEPPLRVVGFTTRYSTVIQYSMRDLAAAFRRNGCEFAIIKQPNEFTASVNTTAALLEHQPDLVVVINHLRSELQGAAPANIPYVCWVQDYMQPMWTRSAGQSVRELDLVVGHGRDVMVSLYGYPAEQFLPTTNLTSPDVFSAEPIASRELEPYRCDVSYAAHGSETSEQLAQSISRNDAALGRCMQALVRLTREHLAKRECITTQDLVNLVLAAEQAGGFERLTPDLRRSALVPMTQQLIDRVLRHQTLEWAARWATSRSRTLRIYGRGWERHPTLHRFACGELEHGEPLRRLYQASRINLQINAYGSLHQRLLDGLASGGFMLSRYVPADFVREPHLAVQRYINDRQVPDLAVLMRCAQQDRELQAAIGRIEELTGTRIAPQRDSRRAADVVAHVACASMAAEEFSDEGLFRVLKRLHSIPHRTAGDISGFHSATFRSEAQMHQMLDRFVDDAEARRALAQPMRECVLEHDTYDSLVRRILTSFAFLKNPK